MQILGRLCLCGNDRVPEGGQNAYFPESKSASYTLTTGAWWKKLGKADKKEGNKAAPDWVGCV